MPLLTIPAGVAAGATALGSAASSSPSWLSAAGASAAGNLLGGVGSLLGASGAFQDKPGLNAKEQYYLDSKKIRNLVYDAKQAGIHPLYALGASSSFAPTNFMPGQPDVGRLISDAGSQFAEAANRMKKPSSLEAAQLRMANASAARDEAQAHATMSAMRIREQEALRGNEPVYPKGSKENPYQTSVYATDPQGVTKSYPNQEVFEPPEYLGAVEHAGQRFQTAGDRPGYRRLRQERFKKYGPVPMGYRRLPNGRLRRIR